MDLRKKRNGKYELRWREGGRRRSRTFDLKGDAENFDADRRRRRQLGQSAVVADVPLNEFVETYWRLHAVPNLAASTQDFYARTWANHIRPRLGDYGVRELSPRRLARFREDLERSGVGVATVRKAMAVLQSILSFAIAEELVEFNAAAGVRKPRYKPAREPQIFLPLDVEEIRGRAQALRDRTLISVLAYTGARPEEVVCRLAWGDVKERTVRFVGTKRGGRVRFTPLLEPLALDLNEWRMANGRPADRSPVFPAPRTSAFWSKEAWANWRRRVWKPIAADGSRPRDLRSSYITVQIYAGVPLTTIAEWCGTSVQMIYEHYAGVIADWDGRQVSACDQIRAARGQLRRSG